MSFVSRGFRGRRRAPEADRSRIPPGQYATNDFPVLSAGPTPHTSLESWTFSVDGQVDEPLVWDWTGFQALPSEQITVDIHCVTKWSKLDTGWRGVSLDTVPRRGRDGRRVRGRVERRRLHDQSAPRGSARRQGVDRLRVRQRPAGAGAWRAGTTARAPSLLLEERQVGPAADAADR